MHISKNYSLKEFVNLDYRIALLLDEYNIDYCSEGNKYLNEVCEQANINLDQLLSHSESIVSQCEYSSDAYLDYLNPVQLCDYLERRHHAYIQKEVPQIRNRLKDICGSHAESFPELTSLYRHFVAFDRKLDMHINEEQKTLFPFLRKAWYKDPDIVLKSRVLLSGQLAGTFLSDHMEEQKSIEDHIRKLSRLAGQLNECCYCYVPVSQIHELVNNLQRHFWIKQTYIY